ncbi:MAG: fluoride efflux transporter CrcB [Verrucomicrobiales bacterium]|nr:fluoride efflux transporter CrcB [Verrucomicrobiales bacterium]
MNMLLVFLGGGLGSVLRHGLSLVMAERMGAAFPWGTLAANVTGSFAIGLAAALTGPGGRWPDAADARLFFMIGICGGYTTFSSFSLQTLAFLHSGQWGAALCNAGGSLLLCLLAVWLGHLLGVVFSR